MLRRRPAVALIAAACLLPLAGPARADGTPATFTVAGSGWGHGVGLSQYGAYGQALEGRDATTIVQYYFPGTTVAPIQDDMDVKVNLLHQVSSVQMRSEKLDPSGGAVELTIGGTVVTGGAADTFALSVVGASISVRKITGGQGVDVGSAGTVSVRWAGTRVPGSAAGGPTLMNVIGPGGSFASGGHRYRYGSIDVMAVSTSAGFKMNVVNNVRVHDEYLYGIAEVSSSWPDAALQAQVIAARSYVLAKMNQGVRKACNCHVDDGGGPYSDQTFAGWSKQSGAGGDRWTAAVNATLPNATQGLADLYNGAPISAFYTSSTGGATQDVTDVWGGELPYAVTVDDHWSLNAPNPNRSWTVALSQAAVAGAFHVPAVSKLTVSERVGSGTAKTVTATLPDGTQRSIAAPAFTSAFGLKSRYLTSIDGDPGAARPGAPAPVPDATSAPAATSTPEPTPSATVTGAVTMRIGPTKKPVEGSSLQFTGQVTPRTKGITVERQMLVNGQWVVKAKAKTKKLGKYTFTIKKAVPAGANYVYRVVAYANGQVMASSPEKTVSIVAKR